VINYVAEIDWEYMGWYKLLASANYYQYNTGTLAAAFQRPEWVLAINNNFTPADKWLIQVNANLMGGIQGYYLSTESVRVLPAILDLQMKVDYQITDRISAFAIGNNLLNRTNQRFMNYPVRGIQGIVGATMRF
jgi:outer membrane receptor for ferric coprogen and ferric-rhodotorulic acid